MQHPQRNPETTQLEPQLGDITEEHPQHGSSTPREPQQSDPSPVSEVKNAAGAAAESEQTPNPPTYIPPSSDRRSSEARRKPAGRSRKAPLSRFLPQRLLPPWRQTKSRRHSADTSSPSETEKGVIEEKPQNGFYHSQNTHSVDSILPAYTEEARNLVRSFTSTNLGAETSFSRPRSGIDTPVNDRYVSDIDYVPHPKQYKPSVFGALLSSRLGDLASFENANPTGHAQHDPKHRRMRSSEDPISGSATPSKRTKWYDKPPSHTAQMLVQAGLSTTSLGQPATSTNTPHPPLHKNSNLISTAVDMIRHGGPGRTKHGRSKHDEVVAELADILARRKYLLTLCRTLMKYGAPTHRVEEYLSSSARALWIEAEFMYIPGAMMITFIDHSIHANNVELIRKIEGLDFGRLKDVFNVYKCVIHEKLTAEEGIRELDAIADRPDPYSVWFRIFIFGLASAFVGPFSFSSRPIDFAPCFVLGSLIGFLQLKLVPRSTQFSNVFEVFACVLVAFIARGLGSIKTSGGADMFCFSGIAQSSIAMILPGFLVLNSALELQSRYMVSGSVRLVYAIIYVLFLGFGLLLGTTIFGLIKRDATQNVTCNVPDWFSPAEHRWRLLYTRFVWVPLYACCVGLIYRAKWKQLPVMAFIAACGYQANFWISTVLSSNLQVANAVGAFAIGCIAHLYSRVFHGLAATAMLPAIYCQVPGGLASSGSLVAGLNSTNQIFGNSSSVSVINNGTQGFVLAQANPESVYGGTIFDVGYGMVQVAIGISVGLYLSALFVYPYGKRRSGLFSF